MPAPPSRFRKATRTAAYLKMALDGPSGSGKSMTALRFAFALAAAYGTRVAAIDSERGSLSLYAGESPDGTPFDFDVVNLTTFSPTEYTQAIADAAAAGYGVLVIDSLSHAWEGTDGALEQVDRKGGNRFTAWKDVTPQHRRMVDAIIGAPMHIIATMRSKTEYVLEKDEKGKEVPRKIGVAPIQRAGMEYEFTLYGSMDWSHVLTVTKSRCSVVDGQIVLKPGASFLGPVIAWLKGGEPVATVGGDGEAFAAGFIGQIDRPSDVQLTRLASLLRHGPGLAEGLAIMSRKYRTKELAELTSGQAEEFTRFLLKKYKDEIIASGSIEAFGLVEPAPKNEEAAEQPALPAGGQDAAANGGGQPTATDAASSSSPRPVLVGKPLASKIKALAGELATHTAFTREHLVAALTRRGAATVDGLTLAAGEELAAALSAQLHAAAGRALASSPYDEDTKTALRIGAKWRESLDEQPADEMAAAARRLFASLAEAAAGKLPDLGDQLLAAHADSGDAAASKKGGKKATAAATAAADAAAKS